jgi:hypothetical protein
LRRRGYQHQRQPLANGEHGASIMMWPMQLSAGALCVVRTDVAHALVRPQPRGVVGAQAAGAVPRRRRACPGVSILNVVTRIGVA